MEKCILAQLRVLGFFFCLGLVVFFFGVGFFFLSLERNWMFCDCYLYLAIKLLWILPLLSGEMKIYLVLFTKDSFSLWK